MKVWNSLTVSALSLALLSGLGSTQADAKTLRASTGLGPKNSTTLAYNSFAEYIAEHSDLDIKVFTMSLLSMSETPAGIRDGLADLGFVVAAYFPAEYSETNLPANLSMLSTAGNQVASPGAAMAGAMTEYIFNCPDCLAEYDTQKQVYLGSVSTAAYILMCTKPIRTIEDLKGTKLRSGAANFSRWAENFGGIAVSLSGSDQYEALGQGVIDCTMAAASELTNNSLFDVTKYMNLTVPGGVFSGFATSNFNVDVWNDLTDSERKVVLQGAARLQAEMTLGYYDLSNKDAESAAEKGIEIVETSPELAAATNKFIEDDLKVIEKQFTDDYKVKNVAAKIAEIKTLVEKWKGLTADVADDPEALAEIYWEQIFSKIDPTTYGLK